MSAPVLSLTVFAMGIVTRSMGRRKRVATKARWIDWSYIYVVYHSHNIYNIQDALYCHLCCHLPSSSLVLISRPAIICGIALCRLDPAPVPGFFFVAENEQAIQSVLQQNAARIWSPTTISAAVTARPAARASATRVRLLGVLGCRRPGCSAAVWTDSSITGDVC